MKTELLAPAKNKEIAFAAIDCGADAVYIGAPNFGARHNACNSLEDIEEVVNYAHKFWAKVFVTVNTILTDDEINDAVTLVRKLDDIGVDAVLIQDMGLLSKLMKLKLQIPVHASTQCDNRDVEKIKFFSEMGLSRVVLARELSLEQIKEIHEKVPDIELEAFVHGALCVSYSGQCYLSQYIGGRSANRGECAQPCRKKYKVVDENGNELSNSYVLCLKDMNASKNINKMIENGVYSFKIEGRLKDAGYVKNVVAYYRQELDKYSEKSSSGRSIYTFTPDVEKSFNRGFTDYFLNKRTECYNFSSPKSLGKYIGTVKHSGKKFFILSGMDKNTEITPQDGLCYLNNNIPDGFLVNKIEKNNNEITVYPNRDINIKAGTKIYRNLDVKFEKELLKPVKRQIAVDINYKNGILSIIDEDNVSYAKKLEYNEVAKNHEKMNETFKKQFLKTGESDFYVRNISVESDLPFIQISEINRIRRAAFDDLINMRVKCYKRAFQKELKLAEFYKKELDYRANVHNKSAEYFYKVSGSNVKEWSLESKTPSRQIELMRTKHCIKYALGICKSPKKMYLIDEKNKNYPLLFDCKKCEMAVLSPEN